VLENQCTSENTILRSLNGPKLRGQVLSCVFFKPLILCLWCDRPGEEAESPCFEGNKAVELLGHPLSGPPASSTDCSWWRQPGAATQQHVGLQQALTPLLQPCRH